MNFDFTDDQEALRDAVRRWVDKDFAFPRRHAIARTGGRTREVYRELGALGLAGLVLPESFGGLGMGPVDAMVVCEELGRGLVNAPYAQAALLAPVLLSAAAPALQAAWLPRIADASALVVLAQQERHSRYRLNDVRTRATEHAGSWQIDGLKTVVPAGDEADAWVVPARVSGNDGDETGIALLLVERTTAGVVLRAHPTQDGARAAELHFTATPAQLICLDGLPVLEHAVDVGIAALCAEAQGVMDRLVAMTVEYMNTRRQFGVAIASFQALRHRIADVKMQLELARSMSYYATLKLGEAPAARRRALAQAKLQLGQSMRFVGQQCIQLHGGIGVTDDCIASHCFKRLTVIELSFGDSMHSLGEVSTRMLDSAGVFR